MNPAATPDSTAFALYNEVPKDKVFYHYTSAAGLYGMVKNRCLWLTDLNYLNDASEGRYVIDLIKQILSSYEKVSVDYEKLLLALGKAYSFSLTLEADLLSQWRGYCANGGYCISFDPYQLDALLTSDYLQIGECVYKEAEQTQFITDKILPPASYLEVGDNKILVHARTIHVYNTIEEFIISKIAFHRAELMLFKHSSFSEEREWRIVYSMPDRPILLSQVMRELNFRISYNKLIPYLEFKFTKKTNGPRVGPYLRDLNRVVDSVIVAPSLFPELEISACKQFLEKNNGGEVNIIKSKIPYRPL